MYTAADHAPTHQQMVAFMAGFHGLSSYEVFDDLFERTGEEAVRHLFAVAASLDSMVVGEPQILAQVKEAYDLADRCRTTGPLTHAVFQAALRVAKRVATETSINERRVSIPSVAVAEFATKIFERFDDKKVVLIGAGEMGQETLRYLADAGARHVTVVNRSHEKALELAEAWKGRAVAWDLLLDSLATADVVVSTTGAAEPIVTLPDFRTIEPRRQQRNLFVLDLAVPRDFDPAIGDCLNVYLYSLDDLRQACDRNREMRKQEWPFAERIIEEETASFMADLHHAATGPTIQRLRETCRNVKKDELARLFNKLPGLDDKSQREIDRSFDRLINKLLHPPLESLRAEARHGIPHHLIEALKRLFQLKD
jgi:glutamyl-tRNA reductase